MAENNPEIQRKLEEVSTEILKKVEETGNLLANPRFSDASRESIQREHDQYRGMFSLEKYLKSEITAEELVQGPFMERYEGRNGLDARPVPERVIDSQRLNGTHSVQE